MDVINFFIIITSFVIILMFRRINLFTFIYVSSMIYFIPIFFGFCLYMEFSSSGVSITNEIITPAAYPIISLILLGLSFMHVFAYFNFKANIEIKNNMKLKKISYRLLYFTMLVQILVIVDLGNVIFSPQKLEIMDNLSSLYNMKVALELILLLFYLLLESPKRTMLFILIFMFGFDLLIGFRYTLIQAVGIFIVIKSYNYKYKVKQVVKSVPILIIFFSFFAIFGNIRTELRVLDISGLYDKMSSTKWWLYNFTHIEPMSIFSIFNRTVETDLQCNAFDIMGTSFVSSFIPFSGKFFQAENFHDCFQPKLFPDFINIASNPWAEAYSFMGNIGIFIFFLFFILLLLILTKMIESNFLYLKIYAIVFLGIIMIYFQRSDINFILFSSKRLGMALFLVYIISKIRIRH